MLYDALRRYANKGMSSFHTPGHKGTKVFDEPVWNLDLTELPETDSLYEADGILLSSEERAKEVFGSKRTLISSGGNTLCIQTMLRLASLDKRPVVAGRNIHRSAVGAMALLGIQPHWIVPAGDTAFGLPGVIKSETVARELDKIGIPSAVYITCPDYYGMLSDIKNIVIECKKRDSFLLVDNAHGTHLKFLKNSLHPIDLGATMSADSAHKTLPVLTGGAWLHINDENLVHRAKEAMALFGSTSPSYPIMCTLDLCTRYLEEKGKEDFLVLSEKVKEIKQIAQTKEIFIPKGLCDPTRITISALPIGYSGNDFAEYLRMNKIDPEFSDENYVVLIPSPFNSENDWQRLKNAILNIKPQINLNPSLNFFQNAKRFPLPEVRMTLREAVFSEQENLPLENSLGRIAAEIVCPCPPGVPVVMPGEVIGQNEMDALNTYGISQIHVVK